MSVRPNPAGRTTLLVKAVVGPAFHLRPGGALPTMRPLIYGYIRLGVTDTPEVGDNLARDLTAYADREGLTLADIFTDRNMGTGDQASRSGFAMMVEALRRPGVYGVLIPSLCHFSRFPGVQKAMRGLIEIETGSHVLIMNSTHEDHNDTPGRNTSATSNESFSA